MATKKETEKSEAKKVEKKSISRKTVKKSTSTKKATEAKDNTDKNSTKIKSRLKANNPVAKRRIVVNYNQLGDDVLDLINEKYPNGWRDSIIKVDKGNGVFFHAIMLDTAEISYLIKVEVKVDTEIDDEIEKDIFEPDTNDDDFVAEEEQEEEYEDDKE